MSKKFGTPSIIAAAAFGAALAGGGTYAYQKGRYSQDVTVKALEECMVTLRRAGQVVNQQSEAVAEVETKIRDVQDTYADLERLLAETQTLKDACMKGLEFCQASLAVCDEEPQ